MDVLQRLPSIDQALPLAYGEGQRVGQRRGKLFEGVMDERPLDLGRELSGLLVNRDDAAGVQARFLGPVRRSTGARRSRVGGVLTAHDLILRILHLQPVRGQLELAEEDDPLMRMKDVLQERLVEPDRAQAAASRSRTSISKMRKRGRRVGRMPLLRTSPATEAATPGRSEAIV